MSKLKNKDEQEALNGFLHEYLPMVQRHVNILKGQGMVNDQIDEGDLHMAGIRGLMEAVHRYEHALAGTGEHKSENPFGAYAARRIRGKMLDHIHGKLNEHVPKHMRTAAKNISARQQSEGGGPVTTTAPEMKQPAQSEPAAPAPSAPKINPGSAE